MNDSEYYIGNEDLNLLMFRFDKNRDGRISFSEVILLNKK